MKLYTYMHIWWCNIDNNNCNHTNTRRSVMFWCSFGTLYATLDIFTTTNCSMNTVIKQSIRWHLKLDLLCSTYHSSPSKHLKIRNENINLKPQSIVQYVQGGIRSFDALLWLVFIFVRYEWLFFRCLLCIYFKQLF